MDCGAKCAKYILFVFNFIFFLLGAALLGLGLWIKFDKNSLVNLANTALDSSDNYVSGALTSTSTITIGAYILIGVGALIFIVGFCGCCGACTENKCLLGIFAACIIVIMILEIAGAIVVGVYRKKIDSELKSGLMKLLSEKYVGWPKRGKDDAISEAWDKTMVTMDCCGLNGAVDFQKPKSNSSSYAALWYKEGRFYSVDGKNYTDNDVKIPPACCKFTNKDFVATGFKDGVVQKSMANKLCPTNWKESYSKGCYTAIEQFVQQHAVILLGVVIAIIFFELLVVIFAVCLYRAIDK